MTMTASFDKIVEFDAAIKVGDVAQIRWTWGNRNHHAKAEIVKVNAKSVQAKLLHAVNYPQGYGLPEGRVLNIPRSESNQWSRSNCVMGKSLWRVTDRDGRFPMNEVEAFSSEDAKEVALPLIFDQPLDAVDALVISDAHGSLTVTWLRD